MSEENSTLVQIGGLWRNKTDDGKTYLAGYLGNARLLVFPNGFKKEPRHPDWILYVAPNKPKGEDDSFDPESL